MTKQRILIIRFSSFGDIVQCAESLRAIKKTYPDALVSWIVREDFKELLSLFSDLDEIYSFERKGGVLALIRMAILLRKKKFNKVYDAHCNLRSKILKIFLFRPFSTEILTRSKDRWKRILLFKFRQNLFSQPFLGRKSYIAPLKKWQISQELNIQKWIFPGAIVGKVQNFLEGFDNFYCLVPSAAWPLKRWPLEYWRDLILSAPHANFLILGGPTDHFCSELEALDSSRVRNLAGKLTLIESCYVLTLCIKFVSNDTGLLHVGDILGISGVALIGPTAFGFPSGDQVKTLSSALVCSPCSKDGNTRCNQKVYQKCLKEITPQMVLKYL